MWDNRSNMLTEIDLLHFQTNLEKSKRLEKRKLKDEGGAQPVGGPSPTKRQRVKYEFRQKETDEAIRQAKKSNAAAAKSR